MRKKPKAKKSRQSKRNVWTPVMGEGLKALREAMAKSDALVFHADKVNHPQHYGGADNPYETIKVQEANLTPDELIGALKFQVHKYLDRHRQKGGLEDIKKAQWYLNRLVNYIESRDLGRSVGP